jgi:hypothetical protein
MQFQELEKGLDSMLTSYGGETMETDEVAGPSVPQAVSKKKASRPSKKARAASNRGEAMCCRAVMHSNVWAFAWPLHMASGRATSQYARTCKSNGSG